MEVMIYLPDDSGWQLRIEDGKTATSQRFFEAMINLLELPRDLAQKCFALWLQSPLLDIQLKPHHIPFRMVKQWGLLLNRFSNSGTMIKAKDEPALVLKRNAFLTKEEEMKIYNPIAVDILVMEAKSKIRQGVYPCDPKYVEQLAVLLCMMNTEEQPEKKSNKRQHDLSHTIRNFVPEHMTRQRRTILRRQKSVEERVYQSFRDVSSKSKVENPQLEFMKICWQLPYYGSVVFPGEVDNGNNRSFASWFNQNSVMEVHVAINSSGIWIIDGEKKCILLGLAYGMFNWEVAVNESEELNNSLPCLFIEFDEENATKLLRVISKQASMMNCMIETCNSMARRNFSNESSKLAIASSDGALFSNEQITLPLNRDNSASFVKPRKLHLTTVTSEGNQNVSKSVDEVEETLVKHPKDYFSRRGFAHKEEESQELL